MSVNMSGLGGGGLRGRGGELPAGGICASQGTFSSFKEYPQSMV